MDEGLTWAPAALEGFRTAMAGVLVGQDEMVESLGLALMCDQHVLIEGVPGLAKTLAVRTLSKALALDFRRVQFTPDLLPSDLVGTQIFRPQTGEFTVRKGPVFTNLVLADEINRAPAKVQSALLEAMEERQVTLGDETHSLTRPFLVMATMNPIEQEGTYPLPEAQLDRFLFKVKVGYPGRDEELEILRRKKQPPAAVPAVLEARDLQRLQELCATVHVDPSLEGWIVDIVRATRDPGKTHPDLDGVIRWGAGPRAVIFFLQASRALAVWRGRDFVMPQDIRDLAPRILRHRILLSYEALAEGRDLDQVIVELVDGVKVP